MSGHNGFGVDLHALQAASDGVQAAVDELNTMSGWGASSMGKGADGDGLMDGILAALQDIGHDGLQQAVNDFGERWEWGVRMMVDEAESTTDALTDTRSEYQKTEDAVMGFLKDAAQWTVDPMSEGTWSDKSMGEIGQEVKDTTVSGHGPTSWGELTDKPSKTFEAMTGLGGGEQQ